MKNALKLLGILALAAIIVFSMAACNKSADKSTGKAAVSAASGDSSASSGSTSTGGSGPLDKLIDENEKAVNEYVEVARKAAAGDAAAEKQVDALEAKMDNISEQFEKHGEAAFSAAQKQRIAEITRRAASSFF
jgi:hypothetical protein